MTNAARLLDELAHAGRENLDPVHVASYDEKEDAKATEEVRFLAAVGLLPDDGTVIDLGAGTGQFTLAVAPRCARVVAVDVSPVMLGHLQRKIAQTALGNIECVHAGFLSYEHQGGIAGLIYSRLALHHLPTLGRPWRCAGWRTCSVPAGRFVCQTSSTTSRRKLPTSASTPGCTSTPSRIQPAAGQVAMSSSASAMSTRR